MLQRGRTEQFPAFFDKFTRFLRLRDQALERQFQTLYRTLRFMFNFVETNKHIVQIP